MMFANYFLFCSAVKACGFNQKNPPIPSFDVLFFWRWLQALETENVHEANENLGYTQQFSRMEFS